MGKMTNPEIIIIIIKKQSVSRWNKKSQKLHESV